MEFYDTTMRVLNELGADTKQMLVVFNKIDKVEDPAVLAGLRRHFPDSVFISIHTGMGLDVLVERISDFVSNGTLTVELRIPAARADLLARLHRDGSVASLDYVEDVACVVATIPQRALETLAPFVVEPSAV